MATSQRVAVVRHGEGFHNATGRYSNRDPFLTEEGQNQAKSLRGQASLADCDLLVVSPLSRAVQTAALIFGEKPTSRVVLSPLACERWSGRCDEGRRKSELVESFPFVACWEGFTDLAENWSLTKSDLALWMKQRVPALLAWIRAQPERHVVIVGHGAFFQGLVGTYLGNCEVGHLPDIPALFKQLQDSEVSVRHEAAAALGDVGKTLTAFASQLSQFLSDPDPELRAQTARALGRAGGIVYDRAQAETIALQLSKLLGDSDSAVRSRAAEGIGEVCEGASHCAKMLASKLRDRDPEVRQNALWALGQVLRKKRLPTEERWPPRQSNNVEGQKTLVDNTAQGRASKRRRVSSASENGRLLVAQQVVKLLHDPDRRVRYFALEAFAFIGEAPAGCADQVAKFLRNKNEDVRSNAAWALGEIGSDAHRFATRVASLLQDPEASVRCVAAEALGEMGEGAAACAGKVAELLRDLDSDQRAAAARSLGKMGKAGGSFSSSLLGRFEDGDASVRESAVESVGKVAKASAHVAERAVKLLQIELDTEVQVKGIQLVGQMGLVAKPFAQAVAKFLHAREAAVRLAAAVALGKLHEAPSFESEIAEVLRNPEVRRFAEEQGSKEEKLICGLVGVSIAAH